MLEELVRLGSQILQWHTLEWFVSSVLLGSLEIVELRRLGEGFDEQQGDIVQKGAGFCCESCDDMMRQPSDVEKQKTPLYCVLVRD